MCFGLVILCKAISVDRKMFFPFTCRYWALCAASVYWGVCPKTPERWLGHGDFHLSDWGNSDRTSNWSEVRNAFFFFPCLLLLLCKEFQFPTAHCRTCLVPLEFTQCAPGRRKSCLSHLIPTAARHQCCLLREVESV